MTISIFRFFCIMIVKDCLKNWINLFGKERFNTGLTSFYFVLQHAEFDWDKTTTSSLTAAFFYGYIVTQIPSGWLADRFGGRRVFGYAMIISAISTLLMPVCARNSLFSVYVLRVILGLATVSFSMITNILASNDNATVTLDMVQYL